MEFPKGIKREQVLGVVKFIGSKEEFLKKAGEIITDLKTRKERSPAEKAVFGDHKINILVYGTVNGEPINEIWFVKSEMDISEIKIDGTITKIFNSDGKLES